MAKFRPALPTPSASPSPAPPPRSLRDALLKSSLLVLLGTFASQGTGLLRAFVGARILGPGVFGVWLGLRLIVDYGVLLDVGVNSALLRFVPLMRGRGDLGASKRYQQAAFYFIAATGAVGVLGVVGAALVWPRASERSTLLAIAALVFLNLYRGYYVSLFKGNHRFGELAASSLIGGVVTLAAIPLFYWGGLLGFVGGMFAQALAETGYLVAREGLPRPGLRWQPLRELLAFGLPSVAIVFGAVALTSVDRAVIVATLGAAANGTYGGAALVVTILVNLAVVPNAVLSPRFAETYGRTGDARDLRRLLVEPLEPLTVGFAALIGAGAIALPVLLQLFLPKYLPGLAAARVAMFGAYANLVIGIAASCLSALSRQKLYMVLVLAVAGLCYLLALTAVHLWPGLPAVAAGISLGQALYAVAMVIACFLAMGLSIADGARAIGRMLLPIAGAAALTAAITVGGERLLPGGAIARALVEELLFLTAAAPFLRRAAHSALGRR